MHLIIDKKDSTYLIALSFIVLFLSHTVRINWLIWVASEALLGFLMLLKTVQYINSYFFCVIISSLMAFVSNFFNGNIIFFNHLYSMIFYLPLSIAIIQGSYRISFLIRLNYAWGVCLIVWLCTKGIDTLFYDVSHNYVGSFLILLLFPVVVKMKKQTVNYNQLAQIVILSIEFFVVALLAVGRGSIISLGVFMVGVIIYYILSRENTSVWLKFLIIITSISILFFVAFNPDVLSHVFSRFYQRRSVATAEEPRAIIIGQYISSCSTLKEVLFGATLRKSALISTYNTNPHNSYINIHAHYGMIGLLMVLIAFFQNLKSGLRKKEWLYVFLIFAFIIRIFTDTIVGAGALDAIAYYLIIRWRLEQKYGTDRRIFND